tara:strand:- start:2374 stop:2784 length:411 start_codon:yes stop_codon:yes gene_type:complete
MSYNQLLSINTASAPAPVGPYNQAIRAGEWLYCSGQIALCPTSGKIIGDGSVKEQTKQVIKNLKNVLFAGGAETNNVVKTTIYLVDLEDFAVVNSIYSETFQNEDFPSPARACVQVSALPKGALVEIDCVAWLGQS